MQMPLSAEQASGFIDGWLRQPYVTPLNPGERHWAILSELLQTTGAAGNLTNDAHIAAIAIEHGYTVYSSDNDFKRFEDLRHFNPLDKRQIQESRKRYHHNG